MIPAYNKKRCAAVPFETGIYFRRKSDFFHEEDTTKSYPGFEPTRLQAEDHNHHTGWFLAFADDIGIIARTPAALRQAFLSLEKEAIWMGLKINENKTKCMPCTKSCFNTFHLKIEVYSFEVADSFTYLGVGNMTKSVTKAKKKEERGPKTAVSQNAKVPQSIKAVYDGRILKKGFP
ncbi:reverse transcriptase domain-containing protein [Trichonephila clavipes]|nr:reverse transcriptase domain-containing protein [Trichonephila clavipes]